MFGTIAINSWGTHLGSVMSAMTNRAMCASVETVSVRSRLCGLLEIEEDRQVVAAPEFVAQCVKDRFSFRREAAQDEDYLRGDRVNHVANTPDCSTADK